MSDDRTGEARAGMPAVAVRALSKQLGEAHALDRVDLEVGWGEQVALLGPNGAGKTTLLRILANLVLPDAGEALVCGLDVSVQGEAVRRLIGVDLGGERAWYWRLTGRQNLLFYAALRGFRRRAADVRAARLLTDVGLAEVADRRVGQYSTGMRTRLSLARALLGEPRVLLLDEPTASIDPASSASFRELLAAVVGSRQVAALFSTHDFDEASSADRVVVLDRGRVVFSGSPASDGIERVRAVLGTPRTS